MAAFFSGNEVLQVAVRIEENGFSFYETLMLNATRPDLKAAYDYLAGEEKVHKQVFLKLMEAAGKDYAVESYPGEQAAYVKALADSVVFTPEKTKELASSMPDDMKALDTALGFEKDSIVFYSEVRNLVREQDRRFVDSVIDQEKHHIKRILDLKQMLQSEGMQEYGH
jgi:rubrerythrin